MLSINKKCFFSLFLSLATTQAFSTDALTFILNGGRLGDNIMNYCKAKWLAYKHDLALLAPSFKYSSEFMLSDKEEPLTDARKSYFSRIKKINSDGDIDTSTNDTLFISNYYSVSNDWATFDQMYCAFTQHPDFLNDLRTMLSPKKPISPLPSPDNTITVAVHVRKGGGFDLPLLHGQKKENKRQRYADKQWPTKFPPDEYYIEQIKCLHVFFEHKPMHIQLFTDDPHPEKIAQKYQAAINHPAISFGYRTKNNSHNTNVVQDLFAMSQCDCLIRSTSSFSKTAQIIGAFWVIIEPAHGTWHGTQLTIDEITITTHTENGAQYQTKKVH